MFWNSNLKGSVLLESIVFEHSFNPLPPSDAVWKQEKNIFKDLISLVPIVTI